MQQTPNQLKSPQFNYTQPEAYQEPKPKKKPPAPYTEQDRLNDRAVLWLVLIWPVGMYFMWHDASWKPITKIIITSIFAAFALIWLIYVH